MAAPNPATTHMDPVIIRPVSVRTPGKYVCGIAWASACMRSFDLIEQARPGRYIGSLSLSL